MRAVVLALTVALVACQQFNLVPEFAHDKTYVYKYEALLLGGLPQEGLARAGIKVSSKVLISATTENTYLMKLMDPLLYEYAGTWPKDPFVPATKLTSALFYQHPCQTAQLAWHQWQNSFPWTAHERCNYWDCEKQQAHSSSNGSRDRVLH
nr:Unknown (protein for MGC:174137) [Danio rerio]